MARQLTPQAQAAARAYDEALTNLKRVTDAVINADLQTKINALIRHIEKLYKKNEVSPNELIAALNATTALLATRTNDTEFPNALASYEKTANTMQGSPSTALKVLGGLMIGVAIAALVAGILIAPMLTMILAFTVAATAASASSMAIGGIAATVALPAIGSLGFFAQSTRGGLSKAMGDVAQQVKKTPTTLEDDSRPPMGSSLLG